MKRPRSGTIPRAIGAALAAILVAAASPAEETKDAITAKLDSGLENQRAGRYDEALRVLREALALNPPPAQAAEALFRIGQTHYRRAQDALEDKPPGVDAEPILREAVKVFEDLIRTYPEESKTANGSYFLGTTLFLLDEPEKALAAYQRTFDRYPAYEDRAQVLLRIGITQAAIGQPEKAKEAYSRVLREFPDSTADVARARKYLREVGIVGRRAPTLRGISWMLESVGREGLDQFQGEPVLLVFFATWCHNCEAEMPHLRRLVSKWSPKGMVFLGVANPNDPMGTMPIDSYVQKNRLEFADVALDRNGAIANAFATTAFPAGALLDRDGIIRWRGHLAFFPSRLAQTFTESK